VNYRHIYHAGNFADVAKHVALLYCLQALCRKESPFFVLDTHAGRGYYELQAAEAAKSGEAERGIQRLIASASATSPAADPLQDYFTAIRARRGKRLRRYPGSPVLIAQCLRAQDRAIFVEMMPAEARTIDRELESAGRFSTQIEDGYTVLKAQLPPPERRGLVLMDPPYESVEELKALVHAFTDAHTRWPTGIFLMWYPIRAFRDSEYSQDIIRRSGDPSGRCGRWPRGERDDDRQSALWRGRVFARGLCVNSPRDRRRRCRVRGSCPTYTRANGTIGRR
jgi:23S rRNA (adenine2030-N6)-methyltransferase